MRRLKVLAAALALCVGLAGCSGLVQSEYVQVRAHNAPAEKPQSYALTVETKPELKAALRSLIENGVEHGTIRVYNYTGNVEEDVAQLAYAVWREEPLGAYAVDYLTCGCSLIVSYYEITVDITFRRTPEQIAAVEYIATDAGLEARRRLEKAASEYDAGLTVYYAYYTGRDYEQLVREYYDRSAGQMMAMPEMEVTVYPESGSARIVEITFDYPATAAQLRQMQKAVQENISAAAVYSRYRQSEAERAQLLLNYLTERFDYRQEDTGTPVYSLLCEGAATSESAAKSWQLLCDEVGLECYTVRGVHEGAEYWWNIVQLDGGWYHVDLLRDLLEKTSLRTYSDAAMGAYYWDTEAYPVCPDYTQAEEDAPEETPAEQAPEEAGQTDEETPPEASDAEDGATPPAEEKIELGA